MEVAEGGFSADREHDSMTFGTETVSKNYVSIWFGIALELLNKYVLLFLWCLSLMHHTLGPYHENFSESSNFSPIFKNIVKPEGYKLDI